MMGKVWVFTGGAHGAGGFSENRGFRNCAGLFEEVIRWDMRGDDVAGRENFVFNTAGESLGICDILREFEQRIVRYHPSGVVYVSGEEDRRLDSGVYGEKLSVLRDRVKAMGAEFWELPYTFSMEDSQRACVERASGKKPEDTEFHDAEVKEGSVPSGDSLKAANRLLEMVCGGKSLVNTEERNRLTLRPASEIFGCNGKLELKTTSMRWLFIGDSITHGALHTFGYDSLPQLWEKYIRGDWGRRDDTVLNTGVSGATAGEFLERLDARYIPYADADVAVVMFGTNDCCFPDRISVGLFKEQLRRIVGLAGSHGSRVVLRTPQPQRADAGERKKALVPFVEAVREVALETGSILVDHFHNFSAMERDDPKRFLACMSDAIHPNAQGQYRMFREMAYAVDMVKDNSMVSLEYA